MIATGNIGAMDGMEMGTRHLLQNLGASGLELWAAKLGISQSSSQNVHMPPEFLYCLSPLT